MAQAGQSRDAFFASLEGEDEPQALSRDDFFASLEGTGEEPAPKRRVGRAAVAGPLEGLAGVADLLSLPGGNYTQDLVQRSVEGASKPGAAPAMPDRVDPIQRGVQTLAGSAASGLHGASQAVLPGGPQGYLERLAFEGTRMVPGIAATVANPAAGGAYWASQMGPQAYFETLEKTKDPGKATLALIGNSALAQLESVGFGGQAAKLVGKLTGKAAGKAMSKLAMVLGVAKEPAQEVVQGIGSDLIRAGLTTEDVHLLDNAIATASDPVIWTLGALGAGAEAAAGGKAQEAPGALQGAPEAQVAQEAQPEPATPTAQPTQPGEVAGGERPSAAVPAQGIAPVSETGPPASPTAEGSVPQPETTAQVSIPEQVEEPSEATGVKNAVVEKELEEMGLPLPEKAERHKDVEVHAKAKEVFEKTKGQAAKDLLGELEQKPRALEDEETALLDFEANRLILERDAAEDAYEADASEANKLRREAAIADYQRAADIFDRVGTESGRSLRARQMMLKRDYSLAAIERRLTKAKGDSLDESERAFAKKTFEDLKATKLAHEQYVTASELKRAELEAENTMLRLKKEVKRGTRRKKRAVEIEEAKKEYDEAIKDVLRNMKAASGFGALDVKTIAATARAAKAVLKIGGKTFAQFSDDMVARFGDAIRPYLQAGWDQARSERRKESAAGLKDVKPEGLNKPLNKIAEGFVEEGITEREALVDAVHEVVQEANPKMSRRDTMDALSGYGIFRQLSKGEIKKKLRDLRGEMRQVSIIEDLEAKMASKKTGFERRELGAKERALAKRVKELRQKLGLTSQDPEARLKAFKSRKKNEIERLEKAIASGDFTKRRPKPTPLDEEALALAAKHEQVKRKAKVAEEKLKRQNRGTLRKAYDFASEVLDGYREIYSAGDFSAVRRQGGFFTNAHPIRSIGHAKQMFHAFVSEGAARKAMERVKADKNYTLAVASKLEFTDVDGIGPIEEEMRSTIAKKLPGVGMSNRAYVTYLNVQRMAAFSEMIESLPHTPTVAEASAIADFVNIATGRASGKGKQIAKIIEAVKFLWAPSYLVSRFQLLGRPITMLGDKRLSWSARRAIGKKYVRYVAGQSLYYSLLGAAASFTKDDDEEVSVSTSPLSSDFGKIRVGDKRYDPLGGLSQVGVAIAKVATGKSRDLKSGKIEKANRAHSLGRFVRSKLGPLQSRIWDALTEKTFEGEKVTPFQALAKPPLPGAITDIVESALKMGVGPKTIVDLVGLLGDGVKVYGDEKNKKR